MTKIETEHKLVVCLEIFSIVKYTFLQKSKKPGTKKGSPKKKVTDNQGRVRFYVNNEKEVL